MPLLRASRSSSVKALLACLATIAGSSLLAGCGAPEPEAPGRPRRERTVLPLRSLRLYETGVGYFERSGAMGDRAATTLPVPTSHLDDALKTLVVLNAGGGGQVTGVAFASSVTRATARARAGLPPDGDQPIAFKDLLVSMKGERVTVSTRGGRSLGGRVIEVAEEIDEAASRERYTGKSPESRGGDGKDKDKSAGEPGAVAPPLRRLAVTLLAERGEVTIVDAQDILEIRPTDAAFASRLDAALDALSTRNAQNARALTLLGDARGQVTFGYIAETPVWRASYRLIIGHDGKDAQIQGWALVHNDTDERWQGVHLELVNGEPDSFLFPLAAPRYARRTLLHPDEQLSTLPQLHGTTADTLWGDHLETHGGGTGTGYGYGSGHGRLGGSHQTRSPSVRMGATSVAGSEVGGSSVLAVGNLADLAPGQGVENGALFVYSVPGAFALDAHASALVPFVSRGVKTENIAYFASPNAGARAAVRFVNTTGQTLPAGTLAVFGAGGFSGESQLDRLKPGERRFLQVGNDLDAEVSAKKSDRKEEPKRLTFEKDRLEEHFLATTTLSWELENRGGAARTLYVGLSADRNAKVIGTDRVDFDEASGKPVVVFDAPPKSKAMRQFVVTEGLSRSTKLDGLTSKLAKELLAKTTIPAGELAILAQAEPKIRALETEHTKVSDADKTTAAAEQDLERLREHLKALGGGEKGAGAGAGTSAAPLVKRILDAEDRLAAAKKAKEAALQELDKKREAVREALAKLAPSSK